MLILTDKIRNDCKQESSSAPTYHGTATSAPCTMVGNATKMSAWALSLFQDRSKVTMLTLYKSMVRCRLEYCCPLWNPADIASIQAIESIQQHFTKRINGFQHLHYYDRLRYLQLQSLQRRRERYIIIYMWKIRHSLCLNDL